MVTLKNHVMSGHFSALFYPQRREGTTAPGDPTKTPIHLVANWKCAR